MIFVQSMKESFFYKLSEGFRLSAKTFVYFLKTENTSHSHTTKQMLTQEDKVNVEIIKEIMTEKMTGKSHGRNRKSKQIS